MGVKDTAEKEWEHVIEHKKVALISSKFTYIMKLCANNINIYLISSAVLFAI